MTIEQAKERRLAIEAKILKMLADYENDGGVVVQRIDLLRVDSYSAESQIIDVALKVEIGGNHG